MQKNSVNNKTIVKNTIYMYTRMLVTILVGLYTSRIVLSTLGASDYGLYSVVAGIIIILASVNGTLTSGTQRFLTYALGENDQEKLNKVFSTALLLHLVAAVIILLLGETLGLWFLKTHMNIPEGRENAAFWVYQFSVFAAMVNVLQIPFSASIVSHERMNIYAYMSIYDVVAKLLVVYLIQIVIWDKLIFYAALIFVINITSVLIYNIYCRVNFQECRQKPQKHRIVLKEMLGFTGWNFFGSIVFPLQNQGFDVLLNIFFNTTVNAARGISASVNSILMQFVNNFQVAVNPQIVKLYASGQKDSMTKLVLNNSKFAGYLYLLLAVPLFVETEFILDLWLGEYPEYTIPFIRIILIQSLIQTLARPVIMVVHAVGKMRGPNLTAGVGLVMIIPVSYILLKFGANPITVMLINLLPWLLETFFNLYFVNKYIGFPLLTFYKRVYLVVLPIAVLLVAVPYFVKISLPFEGWHGFLIVGFVCVISSFLIIYYIGLTKSMREMVNNKVKSIVRQKLNKI